MNPEAAVPYPTDRRLYGNTLRCFVGGMLSLICIAAQAKDPKLDADSIVRQFVASREVPGLAVSVGMHGKLYWSAGHGYADLEQRVAVDPARTKFRVGSIAKPITALALVKLVMQERVDLGKDVRVYLPGFPAKEHAFTVGQLAAHLACVRHYTGDEAYIRKHYASLAEGLDVFSDSPLTCTPGSQWKYSSHGYNLLGAVIERASGKPFLDTLEASVFDPLGMQATEADRLDAIVPGRGRYYVRRNGTLHNEPEVDNSYKWPSGGLLSTTDDLVRFGLAHLEDRHVSAAMRDLLWTEQTALDGAKTGYGIGWRIVLDPEGNRWIGHGGGSIGGTTQLWLFPENGLVIAMAANLTDLDYGDILPRLRALFLESPR